MELKLQNIKTNRLFNNCSSNKNTLYCYIFDAIKNSVRLISDKNRSLLHYYGEPKFGSMLAEISLIHPSDFIILDGTKAFVTGRPFTGEVKQPNIIIIATSDPIAADVMGLAILKYLGTTKNIEEKSIWEQQIKRAIEIGFRISNANQIIIHDENINGISQIKNSYLNRERVNNNGK
ncbi:MAG: DUF362 domain-containing protein [Nitrososphaerota archaeon]